MVSVTMVSALQTSLRSPSVLGRVADIFGDRNLYRVVVSSSEKQRARMRSASGELAQIAELEDRDRLKSALVSSVSHELKTPLTAITMSVTGGFELV